MTEKLMTTAEVAEYLQVSVTTLEHWRSRGTGPRYQKLGRAVRYRRAEVDKWIDEKGGRVDDHQA